MSRSNDVKFSHKEIEALLAIIRECELESGGLDAIETSAYDKLKSIYARQIVAHEKGKAFANERVTKRESGPSRTA